MWTEKAWALPVAVLLLVAGCGGGDAGQGGSETGSSGEATGEQATQQAASENEGPETVADLFPEGEGRELVLNNCAACHAMACAAMGQRTPARWNNIRDSHREHIPSMTEEDLNTVFGYLQDNFDDTQPEPEIPAAFLQRGCTPF